MESEREEWKESWRKEYLDAICAFANKNGGTMFIGKRDNGEVIGVSNPRKMLEEIPNTVRNVLRFSPEVYTTTEKEKTLVVVKVEPQKRAVDYEGTYYTRSGATTVALTGNQLINFLLEKEDMSWTDLPSKNIGVDELSQDAIDFFVKKGTETGRISSEAVNGGNEALLRNYELMDDKGLRMSGAVLFSKNPWHASRAVPVKIGAFSEDGTLLRNDVIEGPVIMQPDDVMDLLLKKYVQETNVLEGLMLIGRYPYPVKALREAILNAISHRDHSSVVETYVRVYPDHVRISNPGRLPNGWTKDNLFEGHDSKPANPSIARVFFTMGYIERYGAGIGMIRKECKAMGIPEPEYNVEPDRVEIVFRLPEKKDDKLPGNTDALNILTPTELKVYNVIIEGSATTRDEIAVSAGVSLAAVKRAVVKLTELEIIERIGGDRSGKWVSKLK